MNDRIISYILTYSNDLRQISSSELYNELGKRNNLELKTFRRTVTMAVENFQREEMKKAGCGKPFVLIMSTNEGYYVPQSYEGAMKGYLFYQARILPELARRKLLKKLIKKKFQIGPERPVKANQVSIFIR
jgi:hypothetical protein